MIAARQPAEPHAQRNQTRVLRTEAHRLAVLLTIEEEIPLIAFEHGPRDLDRLGQAALDAPLDELPDQELTIADRVRGVVLNEKRVQILAHHDLQPRLRLHLLFALCDDAAHALPPA